MDNTRFLSIIAAVIVAIVVMLIGKACTNNILKDNEKARAKHNQLVSEENYYNSLTAPNSYSTVAGGVSPTEPPTSEATIDDGVEYITGILGGIKGTKPKNENVPTAPDNGGSGILDAPDPTEPATRHSIINDHNAKNPTPTKQPATTISTFDLEDFTIRIN